MDHLAAETESHNPEADILMEIRASEKKADEIIERARREKDGIIHEARVNASKSIIAKEEELRKLHEKKLADFKDKARLLSEEKLAEGKVMAKQIKAKSEKNMPKASDFVLKKFEEMI